MESITTIMIVLIAIVLYFLPTIVGHNKNSFGGIAILNLFLGWTIIGWLAALIWAASAKDIQITKK
jgi:hypothetical protein